MSKSGDDSVDMTLGMIEAVNSMADAMTSMKEALESRGWSTPASEQIGAAFGTVLFTMVHRA
jgi:hypothetical protein